MIRRVTLLLITLYFFIVFLTLRKSFYFNFYIFIFESYFNYHIKYCTNYLRLRLIIRFFNNFSILYSFSSSNTTIKIDKRRRRYGFSLKSITGFK